MASFQKDPLGSMQQTAGTLVSHGSNQWLLVLGVDLQWATDANRSNLVGGWFTPLKNMSSSIGMISNPILMGK